jgi:hypothetical protein
VPLGHVVLHLPYTSPAGPVDDDGNGSTSRPYSPLAPHVGIIRWLWHPILSWQAAWSTGTPDKSRMGVRQHSVGPPDAVGDVSSQVWHVVATGHVETCPLPSWC